MIKVHPAPSEICGCYHCFRIFRKEEIHTWHGKYAECPACGIDSVEFYSSSMGIGDIAIDLDKRAKVAWAIVDDEGNPTGDHMLERFRTNET